MSNQRTKDRNDQDLAAVIKFFKECCGDFDVKLAYGQVMIDCKDPFKPRDIRFPLPYLRPKINTQGELVAFEAIPQRTCCESEIIFLVPEDYSFAKDNLNSPDAVDQFNKVYAKIFNPKKMCKLGQAFRNFLQTLALFNLELALALANIYCEHRKLKEISYQSTIPIVNNYHCLEPFSIPIIEIDELERQLLRMIEREEENAEDFFQNYDQEEEVKTDNYQTKLGFIIPLRLRYYLRQQIRLNHYTLTETRHWECDTHRFQGQLVYDDVSSIWEGAPSSCKDIGYKESFQGMVVPALNQLLCCWDLKQVLMKGFNSVAGLIFTFVSHNIDAIDLQTLFNISQRAKSFAGMDLDPLCGIPLAVMGHLEENPRAESTLDPKYRYSMLRGIVQLEQFYCWHIPEEHFERVPSDDMSPIDKHRCPLDVYNELKYFMTRLEAKFFEDFVKYYEQNPHEKPVGWDADDVIKHQFLRERFQLIRVERVANRQTGEQVFITSVIRLDIIGDIQTSFMKITPEAKLAADQNGRQQIDYIQPPDTQFCDFDCFSENLKLERKFADEKVDHALRSQHKKRGDNGMNELIESLNVGEGKLDQDKCWKFRLLKLLTKRNKKASVGGDQTPLEAVKEWDLISVKCYGLAKYTSANENQNHLEQQTAYMLRLANSEQIRHTQLDEEGCNKIMKIVGYYRQYKNSPGSMKLYKREEISMYPKLDYHRHVKQLLPHIRQQMDGSQLKVNMFNAEASAMNDQMQQLRGSGDAAAQVSAELMQIKSLHYNDIVKQLDTKLNRRTFICKMVLLYLQGVLVFLKDEQAKQKVLDLMIEDEIEKEDAKLPFMTGFGQRYPQKAANEKYWTPWPIHPCPLFLETQDYQDIVLSWGAIATNEVGHFQISQLQKNDASTILQHAFKHLYGWLQDRGVKLTEDQFRDQAMTQNVLENFLLFPLRYQFDNIKTALEECCKLGTKFIAGFAKSLTASHFTGKSVEQHHSDFKKFLFEKINKKKHKELLSSASKFDQLSDYRSYFDQDKAINSPASQFQKLNQLEPVRADWQIKERFLRQMRVNDFNYSDQKQSCRDNSLLNTPDHQLYSANDLSNARSPNQLSINMVVSNRDQSVGQRKRDQKSAEKNRSAKRQPSGQGTTTPEKRKHK